MLTLTVNVCTILVCASVAFAVAFLAGKGAEK